MYINVVFFVLLLLCNTYTHWFLVHIYIYIYIYVLDVYKNKTNIFKSKNLFINFVLVK